MYESYYKFEKSPFRVVPDPSMLFASHSVREAMSRLEFAVRTGKGITVMTGEVGTGKTTLVNRFLDKAGSDLQTAYIFNPTLSGLQLLKTLAEELGVQTSGMSKVDLTRALYELLLRNRQAGRRTIVFVDEAQALSREALEELRLLSNLETWQDKLLHIFLVGQPELLDKLESYNLRQLRQRVELFVQIEPMNPTETRQYVEHRLRMANPLREVSFTDAACQVIHQISRGIPRTINIVCDASLLVAYVAETGSVTPMHVRDAVRTIDADQVSLRLSRKRRARFWQRLWGSLAAGLVIVAGVVGLLSIDWHAVGRRSEGGSRAVTGDPVAVVHVHSSRDPAEAAAFAAQVPAAPDRQVYLQHVQAGDETWNRVLLGNFQDLEEATAAARELQELGVFSYARAVEVPRGALEPWPPARSGGPDAVAAAREGTR
jgi:type II secretory pathway predicted ATPase ExeA